MQIDPLNSASTATAVAPVNNAKVDPASVRQLVTAGRALNKSELLGQDRQLQFSRDPATRMPVIKIVQPNTGEVIEQIPAEQVLRAFESLEQLSEKEAGK